MLVSITAVENGEGQPVHFATVCTDISHLKEAEQQLQRLAYLDPLTGLPNRALFRDRMEHEIRLARRKGTRLAVLFLDLDHFKNINDSLGHAVGDHVLQVVASRLQDCVRSTDTVARLGGDEFTVILAGITEVQDATDIARKIVERLQAGIDIADHVYHVGASVGIAMHPDDGEDFDTLTRHADTAMYAAKAKGRGRFQYFEARMNEAAQQRLQLENALRAGIDRGEFELHFQPKADCFSGEIVGAEALVRWHRPEAGMVSPELFITIAEDTGLIVPLGAWILRTACLHACRWAPGRTGFRLSVNLSPRQLLDEGFPELLDRVLAETGVDPGWIELEVTEGVVMHDLARARACMDAVRARGIRLAMDDFGTGYSSLSYLQKLPIQSLKIDRSFVQAFGGDRSSSEAAFIRTIVALGHSLDLGVVAEGIETEAQLALLQSCGCDAYQGYHLSRPVPAPEFEQRWLHRDAATRADAH